MTGTHALEGFGRIIDNVIAEQVLGDERFEWDFSPVIVPSLTVPGAIEAAYLLIVSCRSLLLTPPWCAVNDLIRDGHPSEPQIRRATAGCIEGLYDMRRELANDPNASGVN